MASANAEVFAKGSATVSATRGGASAGSARREKRMNYRTLAGFARIDRCGRWLTSPAMTAAVSVLILKSRPTTAAVRSILIWRPRIITG